MKKLQLQLQVRTKFRLITEKNDGYENKYQKQIFPCILETNTIVSH